MAKKSGIYPHTWLSGPDHDDHRLYIDCQRARAQANFRGEGWTITEEEYIALWRRDDQFKRKGRRINDLCLVRIDLEKPWTLDNVEIKERALHFKRARQLQEEKRYA